MSIQELPQHVVNQIAAGEVVERPSHLVKELVENSIDADAKTIEVQMESGNLDLVIRDDGFGMTEDELKLSIQPHATSKIREFSDLQSLTSFGFRGEALASIAAVSKIQISTVKRGAQQGNILNSNFGEVPSVGPVNISQGTEIKIKELFTNVPARLKFLKSISSEQSQIVNVIKSLALVHPEVSFKVIKDQTLQHFWPKTGDWVSRVEAVLEAGPFLEAELDAEGLTVRIVYLPPSQVFKTSKNIWLFAQKRWIQDKSLQFAVMEGYRSTLMTKEFPAAVVSIECRPDFIDVNVHPSKSQVRFSSSIDPFRAIRKCLAQSVAATPTTNPNAFNSYQSENSFNNSNAFSLTSQSDDSPSTLSFDMPSETFFKKVQIPQFEYPTSDSQSTTQTTVNARWSDLDVVGQVHLTYLVCQSEDNMVVVDQHAAHERVLYDKLIKGWRSGNIDVQAFLFPLSIDVSTLQAEQFLSHQKEIIKLGFEIDLGGPETILIRAAPAGISEASVVKALQNMARELSELGQTSSFEDLVTHACATMACHSAVRAGQAMSVDQIRSLLVQMDQVELSDYCPHGRPVSIDFSRSSLEKKFGRID